MSGFASARVETIISMQGEGNAAKAVKEVHDGIGGLGPEGERVHGVFGGLRERVSEFGTEGRHATHDVERGLLGLREMAGSLPEPLRVVAEEFGGISKILRALPGPIGLIGVGITVIGAATYLFKKRADEAQASVALLGNTDTTRLADDLGISAQKAVDLQAALSDLPLELQPSMQLLQLVREHAESLGKEGADAALKFAAALKKGPEGLRDFEKEFGRLTKASSDATTVSERIGLSKSAVESAKQANDQAAQAKKLGEDALVQDRLRQATLEQIAEKEEQLEHAHGARPAQLLAELSQLQQQSAMQATLVQQTVDEANALTDVVEKQKMASVLAAGRAQRDSLASAEIGAMEAQAGVLLDKKESTRQRIYLLGLRESDVTRRKNENEALNRLGLLTEMEYRREIAKLTGESADLAGKELAIGKEAGDQLKARRDKSRAAHEMERTAHQRLLKVQADDAAGTGGSRDAQFAVIAAAEKAEVERARHAANTAKGREDEITAIHKEAAQKRSKVDDDDTNRSAELASRAQEAVLGATQRREAALAAVLRSRGEDEKADLVEARQAWADYQQAVTKANREIDKALADRSLSDEDRKNLEIQRLAEQGAAHEDYNAKVQKLSQQTGERAKAAWMASLEALRGPMEMLTAGGGAGGKLGHALESVSAGVQKIGKDWHGLGAAAPDAISAAGSVAGAFIDNERQKAGVLAVAEAAASIASFATGNIPGGIAHGAAAALYGSVAAGVGGGASAAPAAGGGAGGGSSGASGAPSSGAGGNHTYNVFMGRGFVIGTPQKVAKELAGTMQSLNGTGVGTGTGA